MDQLKTSAIPTTITSKAEPKAKDNSGKNEKGEKKEQKTTAKTPNNSEKASTKANEKSRVANPEKKNDPLKIFKVGDKVVKPLSNLTANTGGDTAPPPPPPGGGEVQRDPASSPEPIEPINDPRFVEEPKPTEETAPTGDSTNPDILVSNPEDPTKPADDQNITDDGKEIDPTIDPTLAEFIEPDFMENIDQCEIAPETCAPEPILDPCQLDPASCAGAGSTHSNVNATFNQGD